MNRREAIALVSGTIGGWPLIARAQQSSLPVIGLIGIGSPSKVASFLDALRMGLSEVGFVEGRNVSIQDRWADGQYNRLSEITADLVSCRVNVIVALGPPVALAAQKATTTIPTVFVMGTDPVKLGLVASLNRPGGNITGVSFLLNALGTKRLELLHELVPAIHLVGLLVNPNNPNADADKRDILSSASKFGQKIIVITAGSEGELEPAFAALNEQHVDALVVSPDVLFTNFRTRLVALAERHKLPTIYHLSDMVSAGGLMSYGTNIADAHRLTGVYAGRILKGDKPADLPVEQSTKFESDQPQDRQGARLTVQALIATAERWSSDTPGVHSARWRAASTWPFAVRAEQQTAAVGFLHPGSQDAGRPSYLHSVPGLPTQAYVEGRNVTFDYRWGEGHNERGPQFADESFSNHVAVIATPSGPTAALSAKTATSTIPIVFSMGGDPVTAGLVASFNRPGGNVTGISHSIWSLARSALRSCASLFRRRPALHFSSIPIPPARLSKPQIFERRSAIGGQVDMLEARTVQEIEVRLTRAYHKGQLMRFRSRLVCLSQRDAKR